MPDPNIPATLTGYIASFTVDATVAKFDIRTSSYSEDTSANMTIRPIPWSPTYNIVVQTKGLQPRTRRYRCIVYTEADFLTLRNLVTRSGILVTPRETASMPGTANAVLTKASRADFQNPSGEQQTIDLEFVMLE